MNAKLTIDRSGRIVVPKRIRDELQLQAGSELDAETSGDSITLRPVRRKGRMVRERGIWVYDSGSNKTISLETFNKLIDDMREERHRAFINPSDKEEED